MRGNCGGPFREGLPLSQVDEKGRFVSGYRVAPNSGGFFSDYKIRSCPIASMNKLAPIISAYHRHRNGLFKLDQSFKDPSCALIECYDILHSNTEEMINRAKEQRMKDLENGTNAS